MLWVVQLWGSVAKKKARTSRDATVAGSIPTTAHLAIALEKKITFVFLSLPKYKVGIRQI